MAGVTWIHVSGDGGTAVQTRTASSLAFTAGDKIVVWAFAMPNGHGDVYAFDITDTATTNNPTWTALATCATNTTSSASFCTKLVAWVSDALTANETFDITIDPQTGSANDYFISIGVGRLTSCGSVVQTSTDIGTGFNDSSAVCTPAGAATSGNLVLMVAAGTSTAAVTYDTPPTNFALVSGGAFGPTGNMHANAVSSTTASASSFAWGFTTSGGDYNLAAFTAELADAKPVLAQSHYRFGLDDGTESAHTFAAGEDTAVTVATGLRRLLRVQVDETGGTAAVTGYRLQYKRSDEADTEWRPI